MSFGISAQGTLIARSPDPNWPDNDPQGGAVDFVDIAELMNIKLPELTRKAIETTSHNQDTDRYIVGVKRHGDMTANLNFVPSDDTQDNVSGLQQAWQDGSRDIYRVTFPEGSVWIFSGFVTSFGVTAPVDDRLSADVTIRPTGDHAFTEA